MTPPVSPSSTTASVLTEKKAGKLANLEKALAERVR